MCVLSYAQIPCVATRLSQLLFPATATTTSDHCTDNTTCTRCHVRSPLNGTLSFAALVLSSLHALAWSDSLRLLVYTAVVPTRVSTVSPLLWHSFRRLTVRQCCDLFSPAKVIYPRLLLESFSTILYEKVRPLVIHCHHIDTLCGITQILKTEIMHDQILPRGTYTVLAKIR